MFKYNIWWHWSLIDVNIRGGVEDTRLEAKARDTKKSPRPRPRIALPWTDPPEAKNRNARGQRQGRRTQAQVLSKKKVSKAKDSSPKDTKKKIFFSGDLPPKKGLHKNFSGDLRKKVFQKMFQALHKILTIQ